MNEVSIINWAKMLPYYFLHRNLFQLDWKRETFFYQES